MFIAKVIYPFTTRFVSVAMMVAKLPAKVEKRLKSVEERLKRIEKELEFGGLVVSSFDWKDFTDRDKAILTFLLNREREGATSTEIASAIGMDSPESGGRTIVYMRLKRIERISKRLKGQSIVINERKRWFLNYEEFDFPKVNPKNVRSESETDEST